MIYSAIAPALLYLLHPCSRAGKSEFGQISRSFSLNSGAMPKAFAAAKALASLMGWAPLMGQALRLKRSKNLTQIGFPSLRSVKSDRLHASADQP
jgi:hypothetical protein